VNVVSKISNIIIVWIPKYRKQILPPPPEYSPAKIVEVLKSISSKVVFDEFSELQKEL
jgi:hypothetical protein